MHTTVTEGLPFYMEMPQECLNMKAVRKKYNFYNPYKKFYFEPEIQ